MKIKQLSFQAKQLADTDDLLIDCENETKTARYYLQSKKGFSIGKNETFIKVITAAYNDFKRDGFVRNSDKFIIVTDFLTNSDNNDSLPMLEWARRSADELSFKRKLSGNNRKNTKYQYFNSTLKELDETISDETVWEFIKHVHVKSYDYLSSGSKDIEILKWYIKPHLRQDITPDVAIERILNLIIQYNQHGADITIENVDEGLKSLFNFLDSSIISRDLKNLLQISKDQINATIFNDIDGYHLSREKYLDEIDNLINIKKLIVLVGSGGVGKSSLIKDFILKEENSEIGCLYLKADTLDRPTLTEALTNVGIKSDLSIIYSQWHLFTRLIIFIDSFEKLYESEHKEAFLELVAKTRDFPNITLIATCRSYAVETLRKKYNISLSEFEEISVELLSPDELEEVAKEKPALAGIIGNPKLTNLIRIPFYLSMAAKLTDFQTNDSIDERQFKSILWENGVEKAGFGNSGESKMRGSEFTKIVIKRASEKVPFTSTKDLNLNIVEHLFQDGLLIKHPTLDLYAPAHDIFEDLVVSRYLYHEYELRTSTESFIKSLDTNPVFRRGLRFWIQDLMSTNTDEGQKLMEEALGTFNEYPVIDEFLLGILSSNECHSILTRNANLLLANEANLFDRLLHFAKIAFSVEYNGREPLRKSISIGPCWNALMTFWFENKTNPSLEKHLEDLIVYWALQFEIEDAIPLIGKDVGNMCLSLIAKEKSYYNFEKTANYLQILFKVIPVYENEVLMFLEHAYQMKSENRQIDNQYGFDIYFYRKLYEMLLKETYRCETVYKFYPQLVINFAKMEWLSNKVPKEYAHEYRQASFGLAYYPYEYFSPSSYQTPFQYLFKYCFEQTHDFLIWLCNRAMSFYNKTRYSEDIQAVKIKLQDGTEKTQVGNFSLWASYRGDGTTPYLIQSALMAFEVWLFDAFSEGIDLVPVFQKNVRNSDTVLMTSVFASLSIAHPSALGQEVLTLISTKEFFEWDWSRYAKDLSETHHTTIGNHRYYTEERYHSNKASYRKKNLESLVAMLQFFSPGFVNKIIDNFKSELDPTDERWRLALIRMDLRNTTPIIDEEANTVQFVPNPFPEDVQERLDAHKDDFQDDTDAISIFLWADKGLDAALSDAPTYEDWQVRYSQYKKINSSKLTMLDPRLSIASLGVKLFIEKLQPEEKEYCTKTLLEHFKSVVDHSKMGQSLIDIDSLKKSPYLILPRLLHRELINISGEETVKSIILDLLILDIDKQKELIDGLRLYVWDIEPAFGHLCFRLLVKNSYYRHISFDIQSLQTKEGINKDGIENLLLKRKDLSKEDSVKIDLKEASNDKLIRAFYIVPYQLLATDYFENLKALLLGFQDEISSTEHQDFELKNSFEVLMAKFFFNAHNENTRAALWHILGMHGSHTKVVRNIFMWFTAYMHDSDYPEESWKVFLDVLYFMNDQDPRVGFLLFILFSHLHDPLTARKLPLRDDIQKFYQWVIPNYSNDKNVIHTVFKLFAGIGSNYLVISLGWLKKAIPDKRAYLNVLVEDEDLLYANGYIQQLYDSHIQEIKRNREALEYYIGLLEALIEKGSQVAFRIRDVVI